MVLIPGLLLFPVQLGHFGVGAGGPGEDLVEPPDAVADLGCQGGQEGELPTGVGLTLDGLPLLSALQRAGVVVADDADGEHLAEDGALGPEDGIDGLNSHVCFLGDGGDGCSRIAITDEEGLRGVEAGRRTPVDRWLEDLGAAAAATWSADCGVAYYSRHYRIRPGRQLPGPPTTRIVAGLEEFTLAVFGADNGTVQLAIVPLAADRRFRQVKEPDVFTAVLRTIPACAAWLEVLEPISPVFPMTGPRNTLRRLVVDGRPVVTGLQGIGDSVCTTNPTFGRGLSLAMWGAADLVDVIGKHDDWAEQTIAMDERTAEHVVPYYEEQAAVDSGRLATMRHAILGDPAPPPPPLHPDRISFTQLRVAASFDPTAFRAFWKLMSMLCQPDDVYRDPHIVAPAPRTP